MFNVENAKKKVAEKQAELKSKEDNISKILSSAQAPAVGHSKAFLVQEELENVGIKDVASVLMSQHEEKQTRCLKSMAIDVEARNELIKIKKLISNIQLEAQIKSNKYGRNVHTSETQQYKYFMNSIAKAYNSTDWSSWIQTTFTSFTFDELEIPLGLASYFNTQRMTNVSQNMPMFQGVLEGKLETETATFTAQSTSGTYVNMTAKNNVVHTKLYEDFLADNIDPSLFEKVRIECGLGIARSLENAILNGDDTATHMDSNVTDAKDFRKAFKGLRKIALANSANGSIVNAGGDKLALADLQALMSLVDKSSPENLMWIMSSKTWNSVITGQIPEVLTVQNVGANATLLTGQMFPLFGVQGYRAGKMPVNLNANAVYDGVTATLSAMLLVDKSRFVIGERSPIRLWVAPSDPSQDSMLMTAKARHCFGGVTQSATEISAVILRNLGV